MCHISCVFLKDKSAVTWEENPAYKDMVVIGLPLPLLNPPHVCVFHRWVTAGMGPISFHVQLHPHVGAVGKELADRTGFFSITGHRFWVTSLAVCFTRAPRCVAPFPHMPGGVKKGTTQLGQDEGPESQRAEPTRAKSRIPGPAPAFQACSYCTWKCDSLAAGPAPGHKN